MGTWKREEKAEDGLMAPWSLACTTGKTVKSWVGRKRPKVQWVLCGYRHLPMKVEFR